jgi:hypothetical protein
MAEQSAFSTPRGDFGEFLVSEGLLGADSLRQARENQSIVNARLDTVLLDMRLMGEETLLAALGRYHETRTVSASELAAATPEAAQMISPRMAARYEIVPYRVDGTRLHVAMLDPDDLLVQDELNLLTGHLVSARVTLELRMYEALSRLYGTRPPATLVLVARRLAGERSARRAQTPPPAPPPATRPSRPAQRTPAAEITSVPPASPQPRPPGSRPAQPTELEISAEDLELFPSLRASSAGDPAEELPAAPAPMPEPPPDTRLQTSGAPVAEPSPAGRLLRASVALQNAEMREDIADALLDFCASILRRRMMLIIRKGVILGWRGEGDDVDPTAVRAISIPVDEPSVFLNLIHGQSFWLGPLPPMARNQDLVLALGGDPPTQCVILPVTLRDKTVCFLYGDTPTDPAAGIPIAELRRLAAKAGLAFQVYILKSKIRTL